MKRIFIALGFFAVLFTLASCQKDQTLIRASITRYHGPEKVHLESNYACWDGDETIWINESTYPITPIEGDNDHFMINMGTTTLTQGTQLNAVFCPSTVTRGTYSSDDNTIGITLPDIQDYSEDGNGNQVINAPMVTTATVNRQGGALLEFNNVCSLLKVQLRPNVICYWIEVTSDNAPLAGTGTLDIDDTSLTMTGTTRTVRLNVNSVNNPRTGRADGVYYIVLPPYMGSKLTVTVYDNPKTTMVFSQSNAHNLGRSEIGVVDVASADHGRGIFSVSVNEKVSFAPGNLKTDNGSYSFTSAQEEQGTIFSYNANNINTYSGAMGSNWQLLTEQQWKYLLNFSNDNETPNVGRMDRWTDDQGSHAVDLKARAKLNNVIGLVILPDGWFIPENQGGLGLGTIYNIQDDPNSTDSYAANDLTDDWSVLESYGVVFLPGTGDATQNRNHYYTGTPNMTFEFGQGNGYPVGGSGVIGSVQGVHNIGGGAQVRLAHVVGGTSAN